MEITRENLIKKLGITNEEILSRVEKFRNSLPLLNGVANDLCVNARDLHRELKVVKKFADWIKPNLELAGAKIDKDYSVHFEGNAQKFTDEELSLMTPQRRSAYGISEEYTLTVRCAKDLAMIVGAQPRINEETKELSKLTRDYFKDMEEIIIESINWEAIREPEKRRYNIMIKEIDNYYLRNRGQLPNDFVYIAEAEFINKLTLGGKSEEIRKFIEAQDDNTRDWITSIHNEAIDYLQQQNITLLKMNMDTEGRRIMLERMFKAEYSNLKPVATEEELSKIKEIVSENKKRRIFAKKNESMFRKLFG